MRVLGSYALIYLLEGSGSYRDANWHSQPVHAGDAILLFPELAHTYGPRAGEHWSELYLIFDGPAFDLWHEVGLLDVARPVHRLEPIDHWLDKLRAIVEQPRPVTLSGRVAEIYRLLGVLTEFLVPDSAQTLESADMRWLSTARDLLETHLNRDIDLAEAARQIGMSYASFRKRFQTQAGVSPARYRAIKRIDAACELLLHTDMTSKQIAESLGFNDEFSFSKRFKQIRGVTPRAYRQRSAGPLPG
jgi:AraC-like DNA-binding protein